MAKIVKLSEQVTSADFLANVRKLAGGFVYSIIYLKIMLNYKGVLKIENQNSIKDLATDLGENENDLILALHFLRMNKMILEDGQADIVKEIPKEPKAIVYDDYNPFKDYEQKLGVTISPYIAERLRALHEEVGSNALSTAISRAAEANARNFNYIVVASRNIATQGVAERQESKPDYNKYWEEVVSRKNNITPEGWSIPEIYNIALEVNWNDDLSYQKSLFVLKLKDVIGKTV